VRPSQETKASVNDEKEIVTVERKRSASRENFMVVSKVKIANRSSLLAEGYLNVQ
jgi:hypothetical protein